jgi:hypothetical protein
MSSYTNIFSGFNVQPSQSSYNAYTFLANLTLFWPLQFIDTDVVVSNIIDLNATVGGLTVKMPDATQAGTGSSVIFNNVGANSVAIIKNDNNAIITLGAGESAFIYLTNNTTVGGTWRTTPFGGGIVSVTSVAAVSTSNNLNIAGSPITSSGTFTFSLANDLLALSSLAAGTGISARTAANTWALRTIAGTANQISVVNGSGVAGNPTISLPAVITGINDITIGNINIAANTITTTNANGDMLLSCNGTGITRLTNNVSIMQAHELQFKNATNSGYVGFKGGNSALGAAVIWTLPLVDGGNGQVISTNGLGTLNWTSVVAFAGVSTNNAIAKYNGAAGALQDSGVIISATNNITGANSIVAGNIGVGTITANTITSTDANGNVILAPNGNGLIQFTVGAAGEIQNTGLITVRPIGGAQNPIRFYNSANTFYTGLRAGANVANATFNLPIADGGVNALMKTDGAGQLGWTPAGAGKLVLISSQVAAASASISFSSNGGTFPIYNSYYIVIRDLIPANNDVQLYITITNYYYGSAWITDLAGTGTNQSSGANQAQIVVTRNTATTGIPNAGDTANAPFNSVIQILNASSGNFTSIVMESSYTTTSTDPNPNSGYYMSGQGKYSQAIAVNGIRFTLSAGNIASGTFTLYGLNT